MAGLIDLVAADGTTGLELVESSVGVQTLKVLAGLAPAVRSSISGLGDRWRQDCRVACGKWSAVLRARGILHHCIDGRGDGPDIVDARFRTVPLSQRGGYRLQSGELLPHRWFLLEADLLIFDPTAHQFDHDGPVASDRYVADGLPLDRWRTLKIMGDLPSHAVESLGSCG